MEESSGRSDRDLVGPVPKERDDGETSVDFSVKGLASCEVGSEVKILDAAYQ
jgi:hypothetical protein